MLAVSLFNWAYGRFVLPKASSAKPLALGVLVNLAPLLYFKYTNFAIANAAAALDLLGFNVSAPVLAIVLPLGISFFTFQGIAYLIDVASGEEPFVRLEDFLLFKAFWPQLIAGPIIRPAEIREQIETPRPLDYDLFAEGATRILYGFFKKVVIADMLAPTVELVFAPSAAPAFVDVVTGILGFGLQIYFDFSAYSDIAIGTARLFGFVFPENFNWPYTARSPQDFWRRWHMTLSRWIQDYVFTPLNFATRGNPRLGGLWLVVAMAICGLWHGAQWTFVLWGVWHGVLLLSNQTFLKRFFSQGLAALAGLHVRSGQSGLAALPRGIARTGGTLPSHAAHLRGRTYAPPSFARTRCSPFSSCWPEWRRPRGCETSSRRFRIAFRTPTRSAGSRVRCSMRSSSSRLSSWIGKRRRSCTSSSEDPGMPFDETLKKTDESLWERWQKHALSHPEREAIVHRVAGSPPHRWRWAPLMSAATAFGDKLAGLGVGAGDVCAIIVRHHRDFYPLYMGIVSLGALPAVLAYPNARLHPDKFRQGLAGMASRSGLDWILTERDLEPVVAPLVAGGASTIRGLLFPLDENAGRGPRALPSPSPPAPPTPPASFSTPRARPGLQKAVMLSHRAVLEHVLRYGEAIGMTPPTTAW